MRTVHKFYMFIAKNILMLMRMGKMPVYGNNIEDAYGLERHQHILPALVNMRK